MKKLKFFLALAALLIALPLLAQTTSTGFTLVEDNYANSIGFHLPVDVAVDSGATKWTNAFSITNFDAESFATYAPAYSYRITKHAAGDSANFVCYLYGCLSNPTTNTNWFAVDTLFTSTNLKSLATPVITKGTANWNNVKAPYYKLKFVAATGTYCKSFTINQFALYFAKKE